MESHGLPGLSQGCTLWLDLVDGGLEASDLALLAAEVDEFESVLGCEVCVGRRDHESDAAWVVAPADDGVPALSWDPSTRTLTSHASDAGQVMDSMQLLHALVRHPASHPQFCTPDSTQEAARLIRDEVLGSYPSFDLRGIDRDDWVGDRLQHVPSGWAAFTEWAQEWMAELGDAHTAVIARSQRGYNPPYVGALTTVGITLESVPLGSAAGVEGVGPGWVVQVDDPERWLRTTGASPQQHARVAARRALAVPGTERAFCAHDPGSGRTARWVEQATQPELEEALTIDQDHASGLVRVRLSACYAGLGIEDAFDDLCRDASPSQVMELDLRGNPGGNLVLALGLRDRFIRERTLIGSIAFSDGRGSLAPARQRWAEPSDRPRWPGRLNILIDSMTYSAAEDLVLGLQGLDHVTVAGEPSGGGSGRPLSRPLGPGLALRVSTAITYDRLGRPVEFLGIAPD